MRTVSCFGSFESAIGRCESVGKKIDRKSRACHSLTLRFGKILHTQGASRRSLAHANAQRSMQTPSNFALNVCLLSVDTGLGQKVVSAASSDPAPNELTDGRPFGQDNARIDIRGVAFAPGDMRLIDQ